MFYGIRDKVIFSASPRAAEVAGMERIIKMIEVFIINHTLEGKRMTK